MHVYRTDYTEEPHLPPVCVYFTLLHMHPFRTSQYLRIQAPLGDLDCSDMLKLANERPPGSHGGKDLVLH